MGQELFAEVDIASEISRETVSGNWRVTFRFDGEDAEAINYEDYH